MRSQILLPLVTALLLGSVGFAPHAAAQSQRAIEEQREAEREAEERRREAARTQTEAEREAEERRRETARTQAEAEREAAERRREGLEEELERAREQMEEAARDVARLSAQFAAPYVDGMAKQWRFAGQRAILGLNPEDTELGVRVAGVSPNGAAAAAGIQVGDVITQIDGAALADPRVTNRGKQSPSELLLTQMQNVDPGESVALRVLRDGQERDVEVQTRKRDAFSFDFDFDGAPFVGVTPRPPRPPRWPGMFFNSNPWQSMQMVALTPELGSYFGADKGILVVRGPGSDALGLRDGDVILDIGGREPTTPEHAVRILASFEEGETLRVNVMRKQRRETLEFVVPSSSGRE